MENTKKKILLINPSGGYRGDGFIPHLGLACLAAVLKNKGHAVLILDYNGRKNLPNIEVVIENIFFPDIIGMSSYCNASSVVSNFLDRLGKYNLPVIIGGPHASCCKDEILTDRRVDFIVTGEAENIVLDVIDNAKKQMKPKLFEGYPVDVERLPYPDFLDFYKSDEIDSYPLLTSRGCPFGCSFCAVEIVSSKKWRARKISNCIDELKIAFKTLPNLKRVIINDDNFSLDLGRAKYFLRQFINLGLNTKLEVSNLRADRVDEELILFLKEARCRHIGIGVEHSDPEVYSKIGKKEKIEDIVKTAGLIKKHKIPLGACMVIGLPNDSLEKVKGATRFVKQIKADFVFWNMVYPYKGTRVRDWFKNRGKIFEGQDQGFTPRNQGILIEEPVVETVSFSRKERRKAYIMAVLETGMYSYRDLISIIRSIPYIYANNLLSSLLRGFVYGINRRIKVSLLNLLRI